MRMIQVTERDREGLILGGKSLKGTQGVMSM